MPEIKRHVGKIKNTGQKCVIVFRVLPESREHGVPADRDNALVVQSDQLPDMYHDNLMDVVNSREAQQTTDLWRVLHRRSFGDGANIINALHQKHFLKKVPVDNIDLYPMPNQSIPLRQANNQIDGTRDAVNERHHLQSGDVTEQNPPPTAETITEQYGDSQVPDPNVGDDMPSQPPQAGMSAAEAGRQAAQQQAAATQAQGPGGSDAEAQAANLIAQAEMMEQDAKQKREQAYSLNPSLRGKRAVHGSYENTKRGFRESDEKARQRRFAEADEEALSESDTTTTNKKKKTTKKKSSKKKAGKKKATAKKQKETS